MYDPKIVVESDFDGYFEDLVRSLIKRKGGQTNHRVIVISAGPWRPYAVAFRSDGDTLYLDFYSGLRHGFGHLSKVEKEQLKELL